MAKDLGLTVVNTVKVGGGKILDIPEPYEFTIEQIETEGLCQEKNENYLKGQRNSLGTGKQGKLFELCDKPSSCKKYALKMLFDEFDFQSEAKALDHLKDFDIAPMVYDAWACDETETAEFYIIMDQFTGPTLGQMVENDRKLKKTHMEDLADTIETMHDEAAVIHNDLHLNNIIFHKDADRFFIIDFGKATLDFDDEDAYADKKRLYDSLITFGYMEEAEMMAERWGEDF